MDYKKNKISFVIFIIIMLFIVIGGFLFITFYEPQKEMKEEDKGIIVTKDIRINEFEDYIIFEEKETLIEDEDEPLIQYKIKLNIKGTEEIEEEINLIYKDLKEDEEGNLVSFDYRLFEVIKFDNYISLIIKDYHYQNKDHIPYDLNIYIFDELTGKLISEPKFLNDNTLDINKIKTEIKEKLDAFNKRSEEEILNLDETMRNLKYIIYTNKIGSIEIGYIVKSDLGDYYDTLNTN